MGEPAEVTKTGNLTNMVAYIVRIARAGHDMSNFDITKYFVDEVDCSIGKSKERSYGSNPERKKKKNSKLLKMPLWEMKLL